MSLTSHVWGRDVINSGVDVICRESDVMNEVIVTAYSCCHVVYKGYDVVNYSTCDLRNKVCVISLIQSM